MTKRQLVLLLTAIVAGCLFCASALAVPAYPGLITAEDGRGGTVSVRQHGDEFFSYTTDQRGNLLVHDPHGWLCYVTEENGGFGLGDPVGGGWLRGGRAFEKQRVNLTGGVDGLQQKLTDLRAAIDQEKAAPVLLFSLLQGGSTAAAQSPDPITENSGPNQNANDPLCGKWVQHFRAPAIPTKAATCSLLILKVNFTDVQCLFDDGAWHQRAFHDGISAYYTEVSNGRFTYEPAMESYDGDPNDGYDGVNDGVISITLPFDHPGYVRGGMGQNYDHGFKAGVYQAKGGSGRQYAIYGTGSLYAYAVEAANDYIDFDDYDHNDDGVISPTELAVLLVSAGYEASMFADNGAVDKPAIWACSWVANDLWMNGQGNEEGDDAAVWLDDVLLYKFTILGENLNPKYDYQHPDTAQPPLQAQIGTACHELGHDLGLSDLYDTSYTPNQVAAVGALSLMAQGGWGYESNGEIGSSPTHLDAYSKLLLGFYDAQTVSQPGAYPVTRSADPANYNILRVNTANPDVYYLIEYRQLAGFDKGLEYWFYPPGGVVYWRINEAVVRERYAVNTVNNQSGNYGIMPDYFVFDQEDFWLSDPFRNADAWTNYPLRREFALESSTQKLLCFDDARAATTMNVWLMPYALRLSPSGAFDWKNAPGELTATLESPGVSLQDLRDVRMDGALLSAPGQYAVRTGSIVIALKQSYLNTLLPGTHTLRVTLNNNAFAEASVTVAAPNAAPKTGDDFQPEIVLLLALLSGLGFGLALAARARRRRPKRPRRPKAPR